MTRTSRTIAALLLALMLPVQGFAAACAQICAQAKQAQHEARLQAMAADAQGEAAAEGHCADSELGAGKCCEAHTFLIDRPVPPPAALVPAFEREYFVARWTNFIPEEPSPPPIPAAAIA